MRIPDYHIFPDKKKMAVTFSYDDGKINDVRLEKLFNKYGVKATFNLNSKNIGKEGHITEDDVRRFVKDGHEIAVHTFNHPFVETLAPQVMLAEILEDKKYLESLTDTVITGMAYPFGTYSETEKSVMRSVGIRYSRTVGEAEFRLPGDFLEWTPTCHHRRFSDVLSAPIKPHASVLYVWGHSYEFREEADWELLEENVKKVANNPEYWYATNGEIERYAFAQRALSWSADFSRVYNPSLLTVYVKFDGEPYEIKPGFNQLF